MLKLNAFYVHDEYNDHDTISANMKSSDQDKTKSSEKKIDEQNQANRSNECEYSISKYEYYHRFVL
jgi:hypothetical protein